MTIVTEIWDAYNENEELLGVDLIRGEVIPVGMYHLVVEALIRHVDGDYLLMQRCFNKIGWPGCWEASAGGSATKGDTPDVAVAREVLEETGIIIDDLQMINKIIEHPTIYYSFLAITNCDKDAVQLQIGETIAYRWVGKTELLAFMKTEASIATQCRRLQPYLTTL